MIGIILLIGIVKKNAIMMIDFALEAERTEGKRRSTPSSKPALRFRPIIRPPWRQKGRGSAAGAWHGYRLGVALPAGHYHRRRPDCQPVSHPVHHVKPFTSISTASKFQYTTPPGRNAWGVVQEVLGST